MWSLPFVSYKPSIPLQRRAAVVTKFKILARRWRGVCGFRHLAQSERGPRGLVRPGKRDAA
ncbi:hypothetical protein AC244_13845 [Ensifer adhaerens]|uniref:Uncharacterized protein n=1 Tax=Ensifer adhaerens TaxID=106592 RepID=A0A0L8BUP6_ENSAD|nr:hypothetical protein AC244_13845 [Ensifer adhaerens]